MVFKTLVFTLGLLLAIAPGSPAPGSPAPGSPAPRSNERLADDVFVTRDTDSFDPGIAVGDRFPAVRLAFEGKEITDVSRFMGRKGLMVMMNRSVDW